MHQELSQRVHRVNDMLVNHIIFSTQNRWDYEQFMDLEDFKSSRDFTGTFRNCFMTAEWFQQFTGLGFPDINPKDKEFNCLTQTSFYSNKLMVQCHGPSHDFEKQCVNEMSRNTLRKQMRVMEGRQTLRPGFIFVQTFIVGPKGNCSPVLELTPTL